MYTYTYTYIYTYNTYGTYTYTHIYVYVCCRFKWKTEAHAIFLNPFTVCSSYKRKFIVVPFADEVTNRTLSICKQTKRTKHTNGFAHLFLTQMKTLMKTLKICE